jgi:hypothetical protein
MMQHRLSRQIWGLLRPNAQPFWHGHSQLDIAGCAGAINSRERMEYKQIAGLLAVQSVMEPQRVACVELVCRTCLDAQIQIYLFIP